MENTQSIEDFYLNLRKEFPKIDKLSTWDTWDWKNDSDVHCVIISEIAREMILWADNCNYQDTKKMLELIENAFINGSNSLISYLGTDFTVTILETTNKDTREMIKKLMLPLTINAYKINLRGYNEPN